MSASIIASAGWDCRFENADDPCGFPAPGAEIFFFDPIVTFSLFGLTFDISKVTILVAIAIVLVLGFFLYAFRRPKLVPRPDRLLHLGATGHQASRPDWLLQEHDVPARRA